MPFKKVILTVIFLLSCVICAHAQFVNYGTDPSGYKWKIATTKHYKIIYPLGNDSMAYRYAALMETSYEHVQKTIGKSRRRPHPVVLHPGNMLSNGMVAWAPRRVEFITTPSGDLFAQSWDRQLAIHESRHVFQTNKIMRGIFNPLYYLLGEQAAGIAAFGVPTWFLEGDAVVTETALSHSGRGRLPEFNMIYRAQLASGRFYSFDKWFLGSYKDYTGTKYALGYDLVSYARYKYGADIWDKTTTRYVNRILSIPPFSKAFRHYSGIHKDQLFTDTYNFLGEEWERQEKVYQKSGFIPSYLSPETAGYTTYKYPQALDDSTVIAVKTSLEDLTSLVMLRGGAEQRLTYMGSLNSRIIYNNGRVYWTENVSGLRWTHQNYSVLKYYDLAEGKIKTLTPRERFQAPAIRDDGEMAAVSEYSEKGANLIVLLSTRNGQRISGYPVPQGTFVKEITYMGDDYLAALAVADDGITLWRIDVQTGEWSMLMKPTWANITSLAWQDGNLLFESGLDGTNNIYRLDPDGGQPYRLTTARFGAFTPSLSADGQQLLFADYQARGYRVASVPFGQLAPTPADFDDPYRHTLAETVSRQEEINIDTVQLQQIAFNPKRYRKATHLFKIHSWTPFYYDASDIINMNMDDFSTIIKPGVMILSQNSLNTAITQLGYFYKDGDHHGKLAFTYTGWYPVFDLNIDYGGSAFDLDWVESEEEGQGKGLKASLPGRTLIEAEARLYIPFNLNRNHYTRGIQPIITYYFTNNKYQQYHSGKKDFFQYLLPEIRVYSYRRMAQRDILPRWGYQLRLQHLTAIANKDNYGKLYAARLTTYLPGLFANNSLMLRAGYQYQSIDDKAMYLPKQLLDDMRGYDHYNYATRQLVTVKADYAFPLFYPDFSIGSLAYIKRLRSNLFFDMEINQAHKLGSWSTRSAAGVDLVFDWNGLQSEFPVTTGLRLSKPFQEDGLKAELLFSISF